MEIPFKQRAEKAAEDQERRLVWGEVYAPDRPDTHGEYMSAEAVEKMAHEFMRKALQRKVDTEHDHEPTPGITIVESFVARKGDPDFIAGAWVVCAHVDDDATWADIKAGKINGFSVEAMVYKTPMDNVLLEIPDVVTGQTTEEAGHRHGFGVRFGPDGSFIGGSTDEVDGHSHQIATTTITEPGGADGHRHGFSAVDNVRIVPEDVAVAA